MLLSFYFFFFFAIFQQLEVQFFLLKVSPIEVYVEEQTMKKKSCDKLISIS